MGKAKLELLNKVHANEMAAANLEFNEHTDTTFTWEENEVVVSPEAVDHLLMQVLGINTDELDPAHKADEFVKTSILELDNDGLVTDFEALTLSPNEIYVLRYRGIV